MDSKRISNNPAPLGIDASRVMVLLQKRAQQRTLTRLAYARRPSYEYAPSVLRLGTFFYWMCGGRGAMVAM